MHGAADGRVHAAARERRVGVDLGLRVGDDHVVKLEALGHAQRQQHDALARQVGVLAEHLDAVAELFGEPAAARVALGHDGGKAFLAACLLGNASQLRHVAVHVVGRELAYDGRDAAAVHGGQAQLLVGLKQAREHRRDLGRGAVAREQAALLDLAVRGLEHLAHLRECRGSLEDRLVLVAQKQEVRAREVAREHHELGHGVILDLVDHDVARGLVAGAGDAKTQVEPLGRR